MNTPAKWANTEPDAGAPHALLERLAQRVPPTAIDEIWIFPTRRIAIGESTVFVVAASQEDPERRRVITARYAVSRSNKGVATVQEKIDEHGTAPVSAVTRIIQGVLRRMGEEGEQQPRTVPIERDLERWWTLVEELGGRRPAADPAATGDATAAQRPEVVAEPPSDEPAPDRARVSSDAPSD